MAVITLKQQKAIKAMALASASANVAKATRKSTSPMMATMTMLLIFQIPVASISPLQRQPGW